MGVLFAGGLDHLVDDVRRGGAVGVSHAEVDNVFTAFAGGGLEIAGYVEDVGRKALEAREVIHACMLEHFS